ncbi:hypothetical protein L6R50_20705 [Myxococcota bacterium]|nr:hypothetical protein [Myxococcota bacterium]
MASMRRLAVALALFGTAALGPWSTAFAADGDGDGFDEVDDCDDANPDVYPGAEELCDGVDTDCDGSVPPVESDADADGQSTCEGDCDDAEAWLNGLDADGDGASTCAYDCDDSDPALNLADADGDGVSTCGGDCDDASDAVHPGAAEACDGLDGDCDGAVPEDELDADGDGFTGCGGDCDDASAAVFPGAVEACNGVDDDCDEVVPADEADGDADGSIGCEDCDDADPAVSPNAAEVCDDGVDNDCNALTDGADPDCADAPPTADAGTGPQAQYFGGRLSLVFDGRASVDAEVGDALSWSWALEDPAPQYPGVTVVSFHARADSPQAVLVLEIDPSQIVFDGDAPNDSWDFRATLTVNDGVQDGEPVTVTGHAYAQGHFLDSDGAVTCAQARGGSAASALGATALAALAGLLRRGRRRA